MSLFVTITLTEANVIVRVDLLSCSQSWMKIAWLITRN